MILLKQAAAQGAAAIVAERPIDVDVPVVLVKNTFRSLAVLADYFMVNRHTSYI